MSTMPRRRILVLIAALTILLASSTPILAGQSIHNVVTDELAHIESQGFALPPMTLLTLTPLWNGQTIISASPVRYVVLITEWRFWREDSVRLTLAHEVYHVLADREGQPQGEELARAFAFCVSSVDNDFRRDNEEACKAITAKLR